MNLLNSFLSIYVIIVCFCVTSQQSCRQNEFDLCCYIDDPELELTWDCKECNVNFYFRFLNINLKQLTCTQGENGKMRTEIAKIMSCSIFQWSDDAV